MFEELKIPEKSGPGWFIATVGNIAGWLTINGIIEKSTNPLSDYYFDTEEEAHKAAFIYYNKHTQRYPYLAEFAKLCDDIAIAPSNESQVMEFE